MVRKEKGGRWGRNWSTERGGKAFYVSLSSSALFSNLESPFASSTSAFRFLLSCWCTIEQIREMAFGGRAGKSGDKLLSAWVHPERIERRKTEESAPVSIRRKGGFQLSVSVPYMQIYLPRLPETKSENSLFDFISETFRRNA